MSYKFEEVLKKGTQKIKEDVNEYQNFLKVMGNNYKYDGLNQINMFLSQMQKLVLNIIFGKIILIEWLKEDKKEFLYIQIMIKK